MKFFKLLLILALLLGCSPEKESNFDVSGYQGLDLNGQNVVLSELRIEKIAINVYSPTCAPCVKEIPALNHIFQELEVSKKGKLYIVADPYTIVDNSENMSFDEVYKKAVPILKVDAAKRKIFAPILVMKRPFRVFQGNGLVTGTPETLLFRTSPLRLYYNFIGPISEEQNPLLIPKDAKVQFFKRMIGG